MTRTNAVSFRNTAAGPIIRWRCGCGHEGTLGPAGSVADSCNATHAADHPLAQSA